MSGKRNSHTPPGSEQQTQFSDWTAEPLQGCPAASRVPSCPPVSHLQQGRADSPRSRLGPPAALLGDPPGPQGLTRKMGITVEAISWDYWPATYEKCVEENPTPGFSVTITMTSLFKGQVFRGSVSSRRAKWLGEALGRQDSVLVWSQGLGVRA